MMHAAETNFSRSYSRTSACLVHTYTLNHQKAHARSMCIGRTVLSNDNLSTVSYILQFPATQMAK